MHVNRRDIRCPDCLREGRDTVRWNRTGWMIEDPGGTLRAFATNERRPRRWTCYGGCKPAHEVVPKTPLARRLNAVVAAARRAT